MAKHQMVGRVTIMRLIKWVLGFQDSLSWSIFRWFFGFVRLGIPNYQPRPKRDSKLCRDVLSLLTKMSRAYLLSKTTNRPNGFNCIGLGFSDELNGLSVDYFQFFAKLLKQQVWLKILKMHIKGSDPNITWDGVSGFCFN